MRAASDRAFDDERAIPALGACPARDLERTIRAPRRRGRGSEGT